MNAQQKSPIFALDPGAVTGFAALSPDGVVLFTAAIFADRVEEFIEFLTYCGAGTMDVVIEQGPMIRSNSPLTSRLQEQLLTAFPDAVLVQPSQWKSHPASRMKVGKTTHENDAAGLGRWFYITRRESGQNEGVDDSTRTHSKRSRR